MNVRLMLTKAIGIYNMTSSGASAPPSGPPEPGPNQLGWIALVSTTGQYDLQNSGFGLAGWELGVGAGTNFGFSGADEVIVHDTLSAQYDGVLAPPAVAGTASVSGVFTLPDFNDADPRVPFVVDLQPKFRRNTLKNVAGMTDDVSDGDELYLSIAVFDGPLSNPTIRWISNAIRVPLELPVVDD